MATSLLDTLAGTTSTTAERTVTVTPLHQPAPAPAVRGVQVIPYDARVDPQADAFLAWMWRKMQADDLVDYYFPGQKDTGFATFVRMMSGDASCALVVLENDSDQWEDRIAGFVTWTQMHMGMRNMIVGGFNIFRRFWDHHTPADGAKEAFRMWFKDMNIETVLGVCPSEHAVAMRFDKRIGMHEIGRIPGAHIFKGQPCDAVLYALGKDEWLQKGGQ